MIFSRLRVRLLGSLRLLAQPAQAQTSHLTRLGLDDCADELRLQFEELLARVAPFVDREVSLEQVEKLQALMDMLRMMAGPDKAHLWKDRALRTAPEWARVRELAADALVGFGAWPRRWGKRRRRAIRASADAAKRLSGT